MAKSKRPTQRDRDAFARAVRSAIGDAPLRRDEQRALARFEREWEEELRWRFYGSIPKKHWREMSQRQANVINEQAERYNLPIGGRTIDLAAFVKAFHDFLSKNSAKFARGDFEDALLDGVASPALEKYREERAALARLDRLERENQVLPRDDVREIMGRVASNLRGVGDSMRRKFGAAVGDYLNEALEEIEREILEALDAGDE